ncbi:hypothetical protein ABG79_02373 [Caloramator mitchellensis]|uniref:Uncharacterized protein n=1 Tax=Caloramator mitchellensis TaxID=908809 RepID=A0A0R3JQX6_CALMK|nr:hypothetical protein [Caloramator mitchellensis]KRQ85859.1 hypothetical protein ABG79_02373 [Caloramator mitchellensis]
MELSQRDKYLIVIALSEYMKNLKFAGYYMDGLGILYRKKKHDEILKEIAALREKVGGDEWVRYLKEYIEG